MVGRPTKVCLSGSTCRIEARGRYPAIGEKALRHAHASDIQRLEPLRLHAAPENELGRATPDVDDQPRSGGRWKHMRDADVDQPRFFVPADDVDGKSERALGSRQELAGIRCNAKRISRDGAYARRMQARESLAKPREASERGFHRLGADTPFFVERGAEAQGFPPGFLAVDLIALHAADLEPEAVRSEVDDGESRRSHGGIRLQRTRTA